MINTDRIVSVTATDLISLYSVILLMDSDNSALVALDADEIGTFTIDTDSVVALADEPVVACDIDATASSVSGATLYFVPAYDYEGFTVDGTAVETSGDDVDADGNTLYKAVFADSAVTISKIGL